jgi:2,5-furandicarboxylate decarboxylase 1
MSAVTESLPAPGTAAGWPATQDLRSWLGLLAERGLLGVVEREVDPRFQLAGLLTHLDGRAAVLFEHVAGSESPVIGNTAPGRRELAALDCDVRSLPECFGRWAADPRPWQEVAPDQAPVLARRVTGDAPLDTLPIPIHHEKDGGRYLSSGVVVSRDQASGAMNLSINRLQVAGPAELRALVLPGRLRRIAAEADRRGEPLDLAICIGVDPTLTMASQARSAADVDELEVCSALRSSPLPVVRAPQLDLWVPARAEIVIEARMRPVERAPEGPFGEFPRTYGPPAPGRVLDVLDIWHRESPIFQTILSAGREHLLVGGIPREADLLARLRALNPAVRAVRLTEGGSCRFHAIVSIADARPGHAVNAVLAAFATNPVLKHVVVVDDDVDVFDPEQVEWAIATRVQADRDLIVVPRAGGSSLDPSARDGVTAKVGVDATVPPGGAEAHARMRVPGIEAVDVDDWVTWR